MPDTPTLNPDRLDQIAAIPLVSPVMAAKLAAHTVAHPSGCHLWTGYTQANGYGYVNCGSQQEPAHRLALRVSGVEVPAGMDVCHTCDVRNCVNPQHLYVGTRRQNMADCTARGRHNKPHGETHWSAKLSASDVKAIRSRRAGGTPMRVIANDYGIHAATVSRIVRGIWRKEAI